MISGTISLYRDEICLIRTKYYFSKDRDRIMKEWADKYKHIFHFCSFQINPDVDLLRITKDGTNAKTRKSAYKPKKRIRLQAGSV